MRTQWIRIIAAAPEMFDLLSRVREYGHGEDLGSPSKCADGVCTPSCEEIGALLARIRGVA